MGDFRNERPQEGLKVTFPLSHSLGCVGQGLGPPLQVIATFPPAECQGS